MDAVKIDHLDHLDPRDVRRDRLLAELLSADTLKEAAAAAGIPYTTARRMLHDPDMLAALTERRQQAARESVLEAVSNAQLARETLREVMADKRLPAHARVRAAELALTHEASISQLFDIDARLAALEAKASKEQGNDRA